MMELPAFDDPRIPVMAFIISPEAQLNPSLSPRSYCLGLKECGIAPYPKKVLAKPTQIKQQKQK